MTHRRYLEIETAGLKKRLVVVGPQPPPIGGGTTSVKILLDELARYPAIQVLPVNTSPAAYRPKDGAPRLGEVRRAAQITGAYLRALRGSDAVLLYATQAFIFLLGAGLLLLARLYRVPFYIKPLGAELGDKLEGRGGPARVYRLEVLRAAAGVLVQTQRLRALLVDQGCARADYLPGYRPAPENGGSIRHEGGALRLIFLSQIERGKGPLLLLEALQQLAREGGAPVSCDFYGPLLDWDRDEFLGRLAATPGARYCGSVEAGAAVQVMAGYDALAFPTLYRTEGHPGVIIEAMQAGIPVISTDYPTAGELITDGANGLIVPGGDGRALAAAIRRLADDRAFREALGYANRLRGEEFRSDRVVARLVGIIFPDLPLPAPA